MFVHTGTNDYSDFNAYDFLFVDPFKSRSTKMKLNIDFRV